MEHMRPSILRRPLRHTSCTKESAEEQYRREQEVIAAKGRRMMATETRLMSTLYPTPEVQQERMQELERTRQEQLAAQAAERRRDEQLVSSFANTRPNTAPAPARPWEGTHMSYASGSEQERARKELASQVAEENRRIALAKSLERQQQRQAEAEAIRQDMQQHGMQGNFWNLGAVPGTGRYIAPEHRWVVATAENYTPMLSRAVSAAGTPRGLSAAGSAPWATTAAPAAPAAPPAVAAAAAAASAYTGLRTPYATTATLPAPVTHNSAAQATAATGMPGVQPSGLSPPWATHSPKAAAAPAAAAVAPSSPGSISSSASNSFHSRNAGNVMAGLLYGEASESRLQYKRQATAAAAADQASSEEARRFPWSH